MKKIVLFMVLSLISLNAKSLPLCKLGQVKSNMFSNSVKLYCIDNYEWLYFNNGIHQKFEIYETQTATSSQKVSLPITCTCKGK